MDKIKELVERVRLTPEEFMDCAKSIPYTTDVEKAGWAWIFGAKLIEKQDAKTASIKDAEWEEKYNQAVSTICGNCDSLQKQAAVEMAEKKDAEFKKKCEDCYAKERLGY